MTIPFKTPAPAGGHILGQPFSIANISLPVSCQFTCNCVPGNAPLLIVASAPVQCEACGKGYAVAFNPANGQIIVAMTNPDVKEPS